MTDRSAWTIETMVAYAALHGLDLPSQADADRLCMMARKAADVAASLPRDFDREAQPAFAFLPAPRP